MEQPETFMKENDVKKEAFKLCREYIGSPWNKIDMADFQFSKMSGGLSSILYRCSFGNNVVLRNKHASRQVLLRFNGPTENEQHAIAPDAIIFVVLSEKKLGPKLLGLFPNGRLEEFIPSRSLNTDDIRTFSTTIARTMAKIHALNVPIKKVPDQIPYHMNNFLKGIEKGAHRETKKSCPLVTMYRQEISWVMSEMEKFNSPVVLCHNDLTGGNILLPEDSTNEKEPNIMFIDFEFGSYFYRSFDIANHFCEWACDYNTPDPPHFILDTSKYPSKEEKIEFIRAYLEQLVLEGVINVSETDSELAKILNEIKLFRMVSHLCWSMWSETKRFEPDSSPFFEEYAKTRRTLYWKLKEKYMKDMSQPNGS